MSWEAVAWANRQKMKKSYEQIVLLVLGNCADKDGEAFAKWPYKDHWWHYLSERTRLPRSSLFRHLNTIVALGLGSKSMIVLADGTKRPSIKLNMETDFDINREEDAAKYEALFFKKTDDEDESPVETHDDHDADNDENDHDFNGSQETPESESPVGTHDLGPSESPMGTDPFPVLGMHKDSTKNSNLAPLPPASGGTPVRDDLWEDFVRSWGEPIPKLALARHGWERVASDRRSAAVAGAKGYWAWLRAHKKPPAAISAQAFLRDDGGWEQWLRYVPNEAGIVPSITSTYPDGTPEAKALKVLHEIAGKSDFFRAVMWRTHGVTYAKPVTPRLLALAQAGPKDAWPELTRHGAGSWEDLLRDCLTVAVRRPLREGDRAPWPFAPSREGKLYTTGPPLMTEQDEKDLADFR